MVSSHFFQQFSLQVKAFRGPQFWHVSWLYILTILSLWHFWVRGFHCLSYFPATHYFYSSFIVGMDHLSRLRSALELPSTKQVCQLSWLQNWDEFGMLRTCWHEICIRISLPLAHFFLREVNCDVKNVDMTLARLVSSHTFENRLSAITIQGREKMETKQWET